MDRWISDLRRERLDLEQRSLLRRLRRVAHHGPHLERDGRRFVNLAGNDYLALSDHPQLVAAVVAAAREHGVGAQASRLVTGHTPVHARVESRFAAFKHAPAALLCPTGYMANLAVLTALAGPGDLICLDKLNHASLIDAARASGATVRVFPHRQTAKLARLLEAHAAGRSPTRDARLDDADQEGSSEGTDNTDNAGAAALAPSRAPRRFIVTDSIFSMDGDAADLPALCDLADRFDAILVVDEAHGTGLLGDEGSGLAALQGVAGRIDVVVSTASKALGSLGGVVTASEEVIEALVNRARSFIYTTAVPPTQAAAIEAALDVIRDEPQRRHRVLDLASRLRREAGALSWLAAPIPGHHGADAGVGLSASLGRPPAPAASPGFAEVVTPIVPLIVGSAQAALALATHLESLGFYAPAIRPPTVPPGAARVRLTLRADLDEADLDRLLHALASFRLP